MVSDATAMETQTLSLKWQGKKEANAIYDQGAGLCFLDWEPEADLGSTRAFVVSVDNSGGAGGVGKKNFENCSSAVRGVPYDVKLFSKATPLASQVNLARWSYTY